MTTPRNLTDVLGPAIEVESNAAAFLLGLDLSGPCSPEDRLLRLQLALVLTESALNLRNLNQNGLRIERRNNAS